VKPILAVADWRMTLAFIAAVALLGAFMKAVSLLCSGQRPRNFLFFIFSPLPSVNSLRRVDVASPGDVRRTLFRCGWTIAAFLFAHWVYWQLVRRLSLSGEWLSYLGAPLVWLMGEAGGPTVRAFYLLTGKRVPLPHDRVVVARTLAEFWGRRWNLWFSDWFRQVILHRQRRAPLRALVVVFLISGVMHEFVLNFSLWLTTGHAPFGSMMLYFGLQAAGILVERNCIRRRGTANACFVWLVVVGPAPLIVNEALLRTLQLWR